MVVKTLGLTQSGTGGQQRVLSTIIRSDLLLKDHASLLSAETNAQSQEWEQEHSKEVTAVI